MQLAIETQEAAVAISHIIANDLPSGPDEGLLITKQGSDYYVSTWIRSYIVGADGGITQIANV